MNEYLALLQTLMLLVMILAGLGAVYHRDLVAAVVLLGVMSMALAVEFYLLAAPDVAIAEAAEGVGLTIAIYLSALRKCGRWEAESDAEVKL